VLCASFWGLKSCRNRHGRLWLLSIRPRSPVPMAQHNARFCWCYIHINRPSIMASASVSQRALGASHVRPTARPLLRTPSVAAAAGKRAPSPYNLFYKERYPEVRDALAAQEGTAPSVSTTNAKLRALWEALPTSERTPYESQSLEFKAQMSVSTG
jgi:hypothetical protein